MNKSELIKFIDEITQGRKLSLEVYNAVRMQGNDNNIHYDFVNVELSVNGDEREFHFQYSDLIDWCIEEGLNKIYSYYSNEEPKEVKRSTFELVVEHEELINYTTMYLNELR